MKKTIAALLLLCLLASLLCGCAPEEKITTDAQARERLNTLLVSLTYNGNKTYLLEEHSGPERFCYDAYWQNEEAKVFIGTYLVSEDGTVTALTEKGTEQ